MYNCETQVFDTAGVAIHIIYYDATVVEETNNTRNVKGNEPRTVKAISTHKIPIKTIKQAFVKNKPPSATLEA